MKVDSADIMATLLKLKVELEDAKNSTMKLVFSGASEAHLLAEDIGTTSLKLLFLRQLMGRSSKGERRRYPYLSQAVPRYLGYSQNVRILPVSSVIRYPLLT